MASEYIKSIEEDIEQFFSSSRKKIEGNFYICGYDPMNMVKIYNRVLCNHFIMLMDEENEERIFLKGPLVVELVADTITRVSAYYS